jgi:uncharacterized protein with NRDE domain
MCLLAIFYRAFPEVPLLVAANREEFYARGGEPPRILEGPCRALAGVDSVAGGTWLGVNDRGVLVAVTNRSQLHPPAQPRSRGLLTRELLLTCPTARIAEQRATSELPSGRYQGCNLLCADADHAVIFQFGDQLRIQPISPGLHVLANGDVDDAGDRRVTFSLKWLSQQWFSDATDCLRALQTLCAKSGGRDEPPICFHGGDRGTVSSTIIAIHSSLAESVYLHAQGPPDRTPYDDYSAHLRRLAPLK